MKTMQKILNSFALLVIGITIGLGIATNAMIDIRKESSILLGQTRSLTLKTEELLLTQCKDTTLESLGFVSSVIGLLETPVFQDSLSEEQKQLLSKTKKEISELRKELLKE